MPETQETPASQQQPQQEMQAAPAGRHSEQKTVSSNRTDRRQQAGTPREPGAGQRPPEQQNSGLPRQNRAGDNMIFVGKKPAMSYVMAVMTQLNSDQKEIHVRARGQSINKAVDVIEIVRNKFFRDLKYNVAFETESLQNRENRAVNVSVIDIKVER